jgi:SH3 domain-containing YSC84-like protein 1
MFRQEDTTMRTCLISLLATVPLFASPTETTHRLHEAAAVFSEIMSAPDRGIPRDLLEKAHCVVVVPALKKAAFVVGAKYGKGFISCRHAGNWSAPGAIRIEGGSFGFQIGGAETDVVLLVMNNRGAERLLGDHFTLGGEGEVAAGPVGRTADAETDARLTAEILSWSRTRGVFAGVSLEGATLRHDLDDNAALYGRRLTNREIVDTVVAPPEAASDLLSLLSRYPSHDRS